MEEKKQIKETDSAAVQEAKVPEAAEEKKQETAEEKPAETKAEETKTADAKATEVKKPKTFAERLVAYRASHCLTQKQMGELMHLSPNHIGALERGQKKPRPATRAKFLELSGKCEIRPLGDSRPMSQKEIAVYEELLEGLGKLSVKRRVEVLAVYRYILKWFI